MDDQDTSKPARTDDARTLSPLRQSDYEAIEAAVMETAKGRWFLAEFARRNRAADTEAVLAAVARLERLLRRERPSEAERMHIDLAEIRDVINRNTSGLDARAPEAIPSGPWRAADDHAVGEVETDGSVDVAGTSTLEFVADDAPTGGPDAPTVADAPIGLVDAPIGLADDIGSAESATVHEANDAAPAAGTAPSPRWPDSPAEFIETPVPDDGFEEQVDEAGGLPDDTDALARANAAIDDAIETLRGVSGAIAGPPPGRLADLRTDPIAVLPRAERLALFS